MGQILKEAQKQLRTTERLEAEKWYGQNYILMAVGQIDWIELKLKSEGNVTLEDVEGSRVPVAQTHAWNPDYSEDRDQEDLGSKPAWAVVFEILSRKTLHKKGLEWLKVQALSSNPSTTKKKKNKKRCGGS
jgi:hypothetical protein